jgi:hypothetical protein
MYSTIGKNSLHDYEWRFLRLLAGTECGKRMIKVAVGQGLQKLVTTRICAELVDFLRRPEILVAGNFWPRDFA